MTPVRKVPIKVVLAMSATLSADRALDARAALALRCLGGIAACTSLVGCATAPSMPVLGAGFPAWLFCIVVGTTASVAVYGVTGKLGVRSCLAPFAVSFPAIAALVAMLTWLIFFPA